MTKEDIIKEWNEEIASHRKAISTGLLSIELIGAAKQRINAISNCIADLKKLNESTVSEVRECDCNDDSYHIKKVHGNFCTLCGVYCEKKSIRNRSGN